MTDFLTRLTELAGAQTAAMLQAEFGGRSCYIPVASQVPAVGVVLHGRLSAEQPIAQIAANLGLALKALAAAGVEVDGMGIEVRGMGSAYICALQGPLGLHGVTVKAVL